ncbi:MAG: hypothetical protein AB7T27_08860 [Kiritimatiellia bacterium]
MEPPLIAGLIFIFITIDILILVVIFDRRRTQALAAAAAAMNLAYQKKGNPEIIAELKGFNLFQHGHSKQVRNQMGGTAQNIDLRIFDYNYTISGGKNSTVVSQTVICFRSPDLNLPEFGLSPETVFHRMGEVFGVQDIDFAEHPAFSKQYQMKGSDESAVRELFHMNALEYFNTHPKLNVEGRGDTLLIYRRGKRTKPEALRDFMAEGFEILALFKKG